ncbi:hypothetical protein L873DRAFT_1819682 [Choiromyces venosus 120613-1]|uniref:Uncharacterized protein n=1 Tax=Choiromyces venosus 120613-1 TaxID=1336337 RepID=A0A3N4IYU5_9PEZI|nr:hypothetical protein L873DRAFT_1819682 [Choiromyces venosus 120613-1]
MMAIEQVYRFWDILFKVVAEGKCTEITGMADALNRCREETLALLIGDVIFRYSLVLTELY